MIARESFPISELAARTGVPAATIHHYLRQGLLPQPRRTAANRFAYDDRHVRAVTLVRLLRERRRLPLSTIKRLLPDLLELGEDQAFRPEMWDQAMGAHQSRSAHRRPATRLLDAAVDAFARRGYADVNVDEICRSARMAKGSFYRHYRSKEELFFAAADAASAAIVDEVGRALAAGPLPVEQASEVVARAIEPRLPLFLEVFTRAVQRRPGYAALARRLFTSLAHQLGELQGSEDPLGTGAQLLQLAAVADFRRALEPSPLAALGVPKTAPA